MIPYDTKPGMVPRAIEVERTKRYYMSMDIEELLREDGVDYSSDHQVYKYSLFFFIIKKRGTPSL